MHPKKEHIFNYKALIIIYANKQGNTKTIFKNKKTVDCSTVF